MMRWLGDYLFARGYPCLGVRLAGHGTTPEEMNVTRWEHWLGSVEDGYRYLSDIVENVVVVGHSTGGALALLLSTMVPVAGVVGISALHRLPANPFPPSLRRLPMQRQIQILVSMSRLQPMRKKGPPHWYDWNAQKEYIAYRVFPVRSSAELWKMLVHIEPKLPDVQVPTLLIHSRNDQFITPDQAEHLYAHIGSPDKRLFWVERSGHNVPMDAERGRVFEKVGEFLTGPHKE
jgi:carboxylesterase